METPQSNTPEQVPQPVTPEVSQPTPPASVPAQEPTESPQPAAPPEPAANAPAPAPAAPATPAESGPQIADDVDVIEKEWVDKAQDVVKKTAGDPHAEEEAVEDLQIDYLKKRFGLDVKKSKEQ